MNLLCCLNDKYLYPMINMLYSIRQYNNEEIRLFLLSTDFSKKSESYLYSTRISFL